MKRNEEALKELEAKASIAYNKAYYHGFRGAIAFIFEDVTIYELKPRKSQP